MPNILLPILAGQWPEGYCPTTYQDLLNTISDNQKAVLAGSAFYNYGDSKPAPELQAYPWLYTPTMTWFRFDGQWISPNPEVAGSDVRRLFMGAAESDIWSYDGGDGTDPSTNPPGNRTGAMWEKDALFDGRSPMGPGAVPGTTTPAVTLNPPGSGGDTAGEGQHTQIEAEVGPHKHPPLTTGSNPTFLIQQDGGSSSTTLSGSGTFPRDATTGLNTPAGQPMNVIHPVQACWVIKRTARVNYVIP